MVYHFRFSGLVPYANLLVDGALVTLQLTAIATALGLLTGTLCALLQTRGSRAARQFVLCYVEGVRNTPLLVQCFFVFFGLPSIGLRMSAWQAAVITLSFHFGAYVTEIIRAGIESIHRSQIEAAAALGLTQFQTFRYVVLFPAFRNVYPALTSQFILLLLGSSVVSQISAPELFYNGSYIESRSFLSFEVYTVVTLIYLVLALTFRGLFAAIHALFFRRSNQRLGLFSLFRSHSGKGVPISA